MEKNSGYGKTAFMLVKPFGLWNVSDDLESVGGRLDMVEQTIVASRDNIKTATPVSGYRAGARLGSWSEWCNPQARHGCQSLCFRFGKTPLHHGADVCAREAKDLCYCAKQTTAIGTVTT